MVPAFDDDALSAVCASCHALRELNVNGTAVSRAEGLALMGAGLVDLALAHTGCVRLLTFSCESDAIHFSVSTRERGRKRSI